MRLESRIALSLLVLISMLLAISVWLDASYSSQWAEIIDICLGTVLSFPVGTIAITTMSGVRPNEIRVAAHCSLGCRQFLFVGILYSLDHKANPQITAEQLKD